ncbi:MAG: XdhC family protein [Firmicutes bacterium]|nr:XdhC family protein [Bacillota bacterium]
MEKKLFYAKELLEKGEPFVVAKVIKTSGSTPGKQGAWMLMMQDGTSHGTVGGGEVELETEKLCLKTFETKERNKVYSFVLNGGKQGSLDMKCGGSTEIRMQYIDGDNPEDFKEKADTETTAYIFGAGHVGQALELVLRHVNFKTVVIDDREKYVNRERFPDAGELRLVADFDHAFEGLNIDENSYIVIVTRGHAGDYSVLKQALKTNYGYLGLMGSKGKNAFLFEQLKKDGYTDEDIANIHAPIGLTIKAKTPEEISVSIAAEMIQIRANKEI